MEESGDGDGAGAAGGGGYFCAGFEDVVDVDVAVHFFVFKRDTGVDDDGAGGNHVAGEEIFFPHAGDDDVGGKAFFFGICGGAVAGGDAGALVHHDEGEWFAYKGTDTNDYDVFSGNIYFLVFDDTYDGAWCWGDNIVGVHGEFADVFVGKAVDINVWMDAVEYFWGVEVFWNRELDNKAGEGLVCLDSFNFFDKGVLGNVFFEEVYLKIDTNFFGHFAFFADVCVRGFVFSDEDDSEFGWVASVSELGGTLLYVFEYVVGDGFAFDEVFGHKSGSTRHVARIIFLLC